MPFNFNTGNIAYRFTNNQQEYALTTPAQAVSGPWTVSLDVTMDVYTPRGADGQYALCYIDARPSFDTAAEFTTGLVNDTNANRGRRLRTSMVAKFDYPDPQTFVFLVNVEAAGPDAWVELRSISGTASEGV